MLLLRRPSVAPEPPGGLALLSGDPIFDGLVGLWVPTISARNLVGDSALFNAAPSAESGRIAARFAGTISSESAILSSSFSFAMAFNTGTPTTQSCVIARGPNSPNSAGFAFNATHANPAYAGAAYVGSSYSIIGKPTGGALAANTRYVIGAKASSAGGSVYWDGVRTATSGALSALNTSGQLTVGQNTAGGDTFTTAPSFEWLAVWSTQIDDDLMARAHLLGVNAFFQSRRVFIPVSAGGGASGTVSYTNANDTSSASGTTTVVGTSSTTNANDTSSASGTTTVVGTSSTTNANDTSAASGTAGSTTGTVDYTNNDDTSTASGWAGTVSGTVDYTNNNDTSTAQGQVVGVESDRASGGFAWLEYISDREREEYRKKRREVYQNAPKKVTAVVKKVAQKAAIEQREPEPEEIEQAFQSEGVAYQPDYGQMAQNAYRLYLQLLINRRKLEQEAEKEREQTRQFIAEQTRIALEDQQRRAQLIEEVAVFMTVAALLLD